MWSRKRATAPAPSPIGCGYGFVGVFVSYRNSGSGLAGEPGFEPGLTESESAGLPLTYSPTHQAGLRAAAVDVGLPFSRDAAIVKPLSGALL